MKKQGLCGLAVGLFLGFPLVLGLGRPATAAQIGVYFDRDNANSSAQVQPQEQFQYYIAATDVGATLWAFECEVLVPPEITVTNRVFEFDTSIDIGNGPDNWIVGLGVVEGVAGYGRINLLEYTAMLLASGEGLRIDLGPAQQTEGNPAMPRYSAGDFGDEAVYEFNEATGGTINGDVQSWGGLKSQYGGQ